MASAHATSTTTPIFSRPSVPVTATSYSHDSAPSQMPSLKRRSSDQPSSPVSHNAYTHFGLRSSPSHESPRFNNKFPLAYMPVPLTGAAALADERKKQEYAQRGRPAATSDNPSHRVVTALMASGGVGISKAHNAPGPTTSMSQSMSIAANTISRRSPRHLEEKGEIGPASVTNLANLASTAQTATANPIAVPSPSEISSIMESEVTDTRGAGSDQLCAPGDEQRRLAGSSYPGPYQSYPDPSNMPSRGLSLPMPGQTQQIAPISPSASNKKHRCPYCDTEFTRHHNLKSHLLTHSQEKPYECQACGSKFRRLHDLKRHMKLHTGERPHICPKCKRKFARGDALARHNKGQGGCAGRRVSQGAELGGEEDYEASNAGDGEDGMEGVMYSNGASQRKEAVMSEEARRQLSLPSIKAQHVASEGSQDNFSQLHAPSTYPPAGPRPGQPPGGLYPPVSGASANSATSPSAQNSQKSNMLISGMPQAAGSAILPPGGLTESPKPLSPSGMQGHQLGHDSSAINRGRSPSLTTQFQQAHFGRQSTRVSPPGLSLPSPHTPGHGPKLPALTGISHPDLRFGLGQSAQMTTNGSITSPKVVYQPMGVRSHQVGDGESNNLFAGGERGMWKYVADLEEKVKSLTEKVEQMEQKEKIMAEKVQVQNMDRLEAEVMYLRSQLNASR